MGTERLGKFVRGGSVLPAAVERLKQTHYTFYLFIPNQDEVLVRSLVKLRLRRAGAGQHLENSTISQTHQNPARPSLPLLLVSFPPFPLSSLSEFPLAGADFYY